MEAMQIYNRVRKVPDSAKKTIGAGRLKGMTDVNPMWRIQVMTETFGPAGIGWYYKVTDKRLEKAGDEVAAFVDIELFVKVDGEWSMPIYGTGGSSFVAIQKGQPYMSDECFKMALTDAISVACKALGVAADVYWSSGASRYEAGYGKQEAPRQEAPKKEAPKAEAPAVTSADANQVTDVHVKTILAECDRTGVAVQKILRVTSQAFGRIIQEPRELTMREFNWIMDNFQKTPSKGA